VAAAVAALALFEYAFRSLADPRSEQHGLDRLPRHRRSGTRDLLCRPIVLLRRPARATRSSRADSMSTEHGAERQATARRDRARGGDRARELLPALSRDFTAELYTQENASRPPILKQLDHLGADARQTDLTGALAALRERYRSQRLAGIIVCRTARHRPAGSGAGPDAAEGAGVRSAWIGRRRARP